MKSEIYYDSVAPSSKGRLPIFFRIPCKRKETARKKNNWLSKWPHSNIWDYGLLHFLASEIHLFLSENSHTLYE